MSYSSVFKMPKAVTIMARTSSITNSFFNGIIPCIKPTENEIKSVLDILGMTENNVRCAYCGDKMTEWDHFRPLVFNKLPTGYITEINNLVPACGKCNQSKGNSYWKDWINSSATLSPRTRNVPNLDIIITRLEKFEVETNPKKIDILKIVGEDLWYKHLNNLDNLHKQMKECQNVSDEIKNKITVSLNLQSNRNVVRNSNLNLLKNVNITDKKIGQIAQNEFVDILTSNNIHDNVIKGLQELDFCKQFLNITFPVLKEVKEGDLSLQIKDNRGYNRYYVTPISIKGKRYLLTSQWKEASLVSLLNFMEVIKLMSNNE